MSKSTKVLGLSILIFVALTMFKLAIMEIPNKISFNIASYTYSQKMNNSNSNSLTEEQQAIMESTLKKAEEYERQLTKEKQENSSVPVIGLKFLLASNSNYNLIEELLRSICLGAITGGIINAIFISSQKGKRLLRSFVVLFIYLYLLNIVLYGTALTIINQSVGNSTFHNFKSLFTLSDFFSVLIAYSIWFLVLWIVNRIYRKLSANRVGSKVTSSKNIKAHRQELKEKAEVEQNAYEMKKEFKEHHFGHERRAKRRGINSEAREEIARENRKSNQEKAELEKEDKENKE